VAASTLERLVTLAAGAARATRTYATVAALAALVIGAFLFRDGLPDSADAWALTLVALAAAVAPPVVLFVLSEALRALSQLPRRIREMPSAARKQAAELERIVDEAGRARGFGLLRVPVIVWRLLTLPAAAREVITPYAPVLPLVSPPFLLASAVAAAAALVELAVAFILLVVLAFT
jgi:hypothetical protein